ncbi:aquaporin-7-like [Watersipora subatra]|uniref:aquaporin-7-like n=1 Tax=Watersipora subatra TaxID=2589382 RepID=UPI00355C4D1D
MKWLAGKLRVNSFALRVAFAEFLGTCILIVFGDGSVAQSKLSMTANGEFLSINWCWCMAVVIGAFVSLNVSGGHINPAVSLAMSCVGRLKWSLLPVYFLAQYIGAFTGAALVYLVYYEALRNFETAEGIDRKSNVSATGGIFATYPQDYLTAAEGFADQVVGTMMLVMSLMALTDKKNADVPKFLIPLFAGLTVFAIGAAYGYNCGYAINPARDLGPRIFTSLAGWGVSPFSYREYNWFWVPIVGPHVGAILGAWLYLLLIEFHWKEEEETTESKYQVQNENQSANGVDNEGLVY